MLQDYNTNIGKSSKLNRFITNENVNLPDHFRVKDIVITKNDKKELEIINF